jgi:hypothetical protein
MHCRLGRHPGVLQHFATYRTRIRQRTRVRDGPATGKAEPAEPGRCRSALHQIRTRHGVRRGPHHRQQFRTDGSPGAGGTAAGGRRTQFNAVLRNVLEHNPSFNGTYSAWEPNGLDGNDGPYQNAAAMGSDATGRFLPYWTRGAGGKSRSSLWSNTTAARHPNGLVKGRGISTRTTPIAKTCSAPCPISFRASRSIWPPCRCRS